MAYGVKRPHFILDISTMDSMNPGFKKRYINLKKPQNIGKTNILKAATQKWQIPCKVKQVELEARKPIAECFWDEGNTQF